MTWTGSVTMAHRDTLRHGSSSQDMEWQCYYGTQGYSAIGCVQGVPSQDMDWQDMDTLPWQCYYGTQGYSAHRVCTGGAIPGHGLAVLLWHTGILCHRVCTGGAIGHGLAVLLWHTGILCHRVCTGHGLAVLLWHTGIHRGVYRGCHPRTWTGTYYGTQGYSAIGCVQGVSHRDTLGCHHRVCTGDCHPRTWTGSVTMAHRDTLL